MTYKTVSEKDTFDFGAALGKRLLPGDRVLLTGDLGAGKSVLARGIAAARGVNGAMPSPTFVLMIPYEGDVPVYHFDLYRLSDPDEFYQAGLEEFLDGDGISIIEWPEMAELDPPDAIRINVARGVGFDDRLIEIGGAERGWSDLDAWRVRA